MCVSCVSCVCGCGFAYVRVPDLREFPFGTAGPSISKKRGAQRRASWQQASVNFFLRVASASVLPLSTQEPRHPFSHIQYDGRFTSPLGAYEKCVSKKFFEPPLVLCYYRNLRTPPFRALPRF